MDKPVLSKEERKIKKQLRRDKQREANVGRAEKMHKLRLATERQKTPPLARKSNSKQQYYVGCSGWFYWHWRGKFYPEGLPTKDWFQHYAHTLKTVELNASFYSWPTEAGVKGWLKQAGRGNFIYTVKVCELITHIKRFKGTKTLVKDFGYIADLLGKHMGCFLFQLPPSFKYTPGRLKTILEQLDPTRRNVVEFRHSSWWNDTVYKAFRQSGTIFCSCSAPKLPDELIKTADDIYIRLHGTQRWYRHNYSDAELRKWALAIKASGAKRAWVYFNNDFDSYAVKNADTLIRLLKSKKL